LTYDTWHYHHQNQDFAALARAVPDTMMVLDHFGTPLGVGVYADRREEIFAQWKLDIVERVSNLVCSARPPRKERGTRFSPHWTQNFAEP